MRAGLAPFAAQVAESRGRAVHEPESPPRGAFERDRDRIIHSAAFRRLKHKTQVFVYHEGDHYRTRLTHSLEVAQVARSISRALGLDEDLTEALALAHDLGHTPFGHAGERELDSLMKAHGGFDHNAQALRLVTRLECRYAAFDGLNLTWETLEGLIKHNGPVQADAPLAVLEIAQDRDIPLSGYASLEAQVAAISDDIAYNAHDMDDGLRARLFDVIDLGDVPLAGEALADVLKTWPKLDRSRVIHETVRRVISWMVADVVSETARRLKKHAPVSAAEVRALDGQMAGLSPQLAEKNKVLQSFLSRRMYRNERVSEAMDRAQRVIRDLFEAYMNDPALLPPGWQEQAVGRSDRQSARQVCDFIAGMTDRYAIEQHKRLFDLDPLFR
jgi:dGTPase